MARLQFRVISIALDAEEEVARITALARNDAYEVITGILGQVQTPTRERGGTEMTVILPVSQMLDLFRECGRMNGYDPRHDRGGHEIYESLSSVVYGLMDD
ncbi:hypothetical protein ACFY4C_20860 [Actinomadura viridis]|uniref:hypothetical protein n=1 Tax=Actinomadura viridis TaxID=58110 RepID=UPI00368F7361